MDGNDRNTSVIDVLIVPAQLESISIARTWLRAIAAEQWRVDDHIPRLAVTELVTNATRHSIADQPITVRAYKCDDTHGLEVHDLCPDLPIIKDAAPMAESGRGLFLLSQLVAAIGVHPTLPAVSGKNVYVEFL
jgi:anti-sigma regulatory factor (Ser/Thr protein kinase)